MGGIRSAGPIRVPIQSRLLHREDYLPAKTELRYDPADPLAVTFAITTGTEHEPVLWTCDRGLVREAVRGHDAGEGDIQLHAPIWGNMGNTPQQHVTVKLSSPDGEAMLQLRHKDLARATKEIWDLVSDEECKTAVSDALERELPGLLGP